VALPTNISYGTVVGQFLASVADSSDDDMLPDGVPMSGTVMFVASAGYVLDYSATPNPVTIVKTPITCRLDSNGYLCSPYPGAGGTLSPGVLLVATDDPDLQPVGWNWTVIYSLTDPSGTRVNLPTQSINVPTSATVDLTTAMTIASSGGVYITKGDKGDQGIQGIQGVQGIQGIQGVIGNPGPANTLTVGTVTSGPTASVTITGSSPNQTVNVVLPQYSPDQMALQIAMATAF
jgi:hypothetical protein